MYLKINMFTLMAAWVCVTVLAHTSGHTHSKSRGDVRLQNSSDDEVGDLTDILFQTFCESCETQRSLARHTLEKTEETAKALAQADVRMKRVDNSSREYETRMLELEKQLKGEKAINAQIQLESENTTKMFEHRIMELEHKLEHKAWVCVTMLAHINGQPLSKSRGDVRLQNSGDDGVGDLTDILFQTFCESFEIQRLLARHTLEKTEETAKVLAQADVRMKGVDNSSREYETLMLELEKQLKGEQAARGC